MLQIRCLLAALTTVTLLAAIQADQPDKAAARLIEDTAIRQAQTKRAFESFREKLAVLAGRYENSSSAKERDRAKALRGALRHISESGVAYKFDSLIAALNRKGADKDIDVLAQVLRDNKELRRDLQKLLALLMEDDRGKRLAERLKDARQLLALLTELRNKQDRLRALTERGKHEPKELVKPQEKLTKATRDVLPAKPDPMNPIETVRKPVEEAVAEQDKATTQLGKGDGSMAGASQGRAVAMLDEAIRRLRDVSRVTRQEEREQKLAALLARCRKMLALQKEILEGTEHLAREVDKTASVAQAARSNKLADKQDESLKEAEAALKMIKDEGTAAAFAEVFEQVRDDMTAVLNRLLKADTGPLTRSIESDLVAAIEEIIRALEQAKRENESPGSPPGDGPSGQPPFINLLQQLKMIHAMQRRIHDRTALYGKRYPGEQVPNPSTAVNDKEREKFARIQKELQDLAGRQKRIGRATRDLVSQADARGRRID
jgi:hypothetical protein